MKKRDLNNLDLLDLSTMITDNEDVISSSDFDKTPISSFLFFNQ